VSAALSCPDTAYLVVVAPADQLDATASLVQRAASPRGVPVDVVTGGIERGDSVLAGVRAVPPGVEIVLVHDAARAFAPPELFGEVAAAVRAGHPAVVPGEPVVDTIKAVDAAGLVTGTPDRRSLRAIQTPQGFQRPVLVAAHEHGSSATDDAALVERLGLPVLVVAGRPEAFKVTTSEDLHRAERLVAAGAG
jgi:2-C-methyl-D-erythritol 4-phosphate cytidylyltransferase